MLEKVRFLSIIFLAIAVALTANKAIISVKQILQIVNYGQNMQRLKEEKDKYGIQYIKSQNSDFVAWISVKDVGIELPIVETKTTADEDFYLTHDFWKYENPLGCPYQTKNSNFLTTENVSVAGHSTYNFGFEWSRGSQNIFGNLYSYLWKNSSFDYTIKIETLTEQRRYKVFATILFDAEKDTTGSWLFNTTELKTESSFNNFCDTAKNMSTENYDVETVYGKKLISLLTCAKSNLSKRVLICAVEQ